MIQATGLNIEQVASNTLSLLPKIQIQNTQTSYYLQR
jgi:hypothetical protein